LKDLRETPEEKESSEEEREREREKKGTKELSRVSLSSPEPHFSARTTESLSKGKSVHIIDLY